MTNHLKYKNIESFPFANSRRKDGNIKFAYIKQNF